MRFWIEGPKKVILFEDTGKSEFKYHVVTEADGDYSYCVENLSDLKNVIVDIIYVTGVDARDYSELI